MTEGYETSSYGFKYRESMITAISAGVFFVMIGALFIITPALFTRVTEFFRDFSPNVFVRVPNTMIYLPAPTRPLIHRVVYTAFEQFCFAFGVFQAVVLALRFAARSSVSNKAETVGNLISWIGTGYLARTLLLEPTTWSALTTWFVFWAAVLMLLGVTLIVRAIILAVALPRRMF